MLDLITQMERILDEDIDNEEELTTLSVKIGKLINRDTEEEEIDKELNNDNEETTFDGLKKKYGVSQEKINEVMWMLSSFGIIIKNNDLEKAIFEYKQKEN